jgi:GNAT superfamily N-acetyltransferase
VRPPGLLGYIDGTVSGWVAIEPKDAYPRLVRSRNLQPVDDEPAWAVTCFYIAPKARRKGLSAAMLEAAVQWAAENGARIVEGYPSLSNPHDWMGLPTTYERCGFERVSEPRGKRVIMRRRV